jgi:K+-transporting ATPase ATPase C chain
MLQELRTAAVLLLALTALTGGFYPLVVTAVARVAFPRQARGSLIQSGEEIVGSELIGQSFTRPEYFWGRLSATGPGPYNAAASSGSNYGPLHPALTEAVESRIAALRKGGATPDAIPVDLVTASGSGLDPHISPAAAAVQVPRVAASRRMTEDEVRTLIEQHTQLRQFGILGENRVNVLRLNQAMDSHPREGHEPHP